MSTEELERLKMRINLKINSLSSAIKAKQIDHSKGGEGATKEWYINHRYALTINQRVLPYINSLIKQRRRRLSDHFMDQARKLLPQDEFEMILKNAQIKMEGNQ
jgi:hypothetical protein